MASITKRANRYRALIRKHGETKCRTFGSRKDAEAWAAATESKLEEVAIYGYASPKAATVKDLITAFDDAGQVKNASTRSILRVTSRELGSQRLSNFDFNNCLCWAEQRMNNGATAATACVYISTLGRVFRWGRSSRRLNLPVDVFGDVRAHLRSLGHRTKPRARERMPTETEVRAIIEHFAHDWRPGRVPMHEIVRVAADTAMRRGEIVRITAGDFDYNRRELTIRARKHPREKRDATIPILFDETLAILQHRCQGLSPANPIFQYDGRSVGKAFTSAMHKLGLSGVVFHSLRHYAASRLIASGLSIPLTAVVTSHSDWAMLKRYTHITASDVHRAWRGHGA